MSFILGCSLREGGLPCYEMSAINADKPPLGLADIKERLTQFRNGTAMTFDMHMMLQYFCLVFRLTNLNKG